MAFYLDKSPIIACSTGTTSNAAIAVIRLSGFNSINDLQMFFSFDFSKIKNRYAHLSNILDNENIIDNIILTFFPKISSYTGENLLELSVHGNQLNVSRIINIFISSQHFRLANPGEFSYRALQSGKLSLTQAEGLDLLLNANSTLMLDQGMQLLQGELHLKYLEFYNSFLKLKSAIEISIDFSDDVGDDHVDILLKNSLKNFRDNLISLYSRSQSSISSLMTPHLVICGETNAGKSSLFNILLKHNRSIVSPAAGTTRDYISESLMISGTNFLLVDTAGIRDSSDLIESEGIDRAFTILNSAFYKILIINPVSYNEVYLRRFIDISFDIIIFSHFDSSDFLNSLKKINLNFLSTKSYICGSLISGSIGPLSAAGPIEPLIDFSLIFSNGPIEPLNASDPIEPFLFLDISNKFKSISDSNPLLVDRHRLCIQHIYTKFIEIDNMICNVKDVAIISSEINILQGYLSELLGIVSPDDVLNSIFSNFCIGK